MARFTDPELNAIDQRIRQRLKPSRYEHSVGVCESARTMARIYGVDQRKAAVAGLLHDWDKALSFDQLRHKAQELNLADAYVRQAMPCVLHSFTAAATLSQEFSGLYSEILQAIERHTCGAEDMSPLDMVVFIADLIEPNRNFDSAVRLRRLLGEVSLDELYYQAYKETVLNLLHTDRTIYPESVNIYNHLVQRRQAEVLENS